ncbi:MAG TPA: hypothetical protein VFK69_09215 [Candidatus Eisenbacteria bacterium]|nr:hypothetical protein [Candidatus Eisenbacteria bacterium]
MLAPAAVLAILLAPLPGPTVAVEDTMRTEVPEVLVRAPRVTLDEILARVARGEARRDSLLRDESFLATLRVVRAAHGDHPPELVAESVSRVYRARPHRVRTLVLRRWEAKPGKRKSGDMDMNFDASMDETIVNFAFRPGARDQFRYAIVGRDLVGGHLVYRIRFEPRSLLDPAAPHGLVWVDTNEFVIVRQEVGFDHPPAPPLISGVDRMVIEREFVDGMWMLHRVLLRLEFGLPLPKVGRGLDMSMQFDQIAVNRGIPDSVFTAPLVKR